MNEPNPPDVIDRSSIVASVFLLFLLILMAGALAVYVLSDPAISQALIMANMAIQVRDVYPTDVDWNRVIESGRNAMFDKLDRYSNYVSKPQFENLDEDLTGGYTGIGVSIISHDDGLLIMTVREDGPAAEVGLLSGDIIIEVDSLSLADMPPEEAVEKLRGKEGSIVTLGVSRPVTGEFFNVNVTRRRLLFLHIPFAGFTEDSLLYVRLLDFDAGATEDLKLALDTLLQKNTSRPKGLILDLRGNPGGFFVEAYETADLFLKAGVFMVGTDGRSRWNDEQFYSTGGDITDGLPMAVIVDRGSASAAEIVAGSLRQAGRAILVGDTTFGKGLVQGFVRFPDGDGIKLTTSRYYFEGPIYLNDFDSTLHDTGHGLIPDYYFNLHAVDPFQRELENSMLLRQFANKYQDDIIAATQNDTLGDFWLANFQVFAGDNEFSYRSWRTVLGDAMKAVAEFEKASPSTSNEISQFIRQSEQFDRRAFVENAEYIKNRLKQIAFERKYGTYYAYKEVILKTRLEITYTAKLLRERN